MKFDQLIKFTNKVAVFATIALFYWVFIFLVITVFDLKIFRENMTETFYLSLIGIFAILGGAIVLNVMSNLSKISDSLAQGRSDATLSNKPRKAAIIALVLSFPLVCGLLFAGNSLSAEKKKKMLVTSAQSLVSENRTQLSCLAEYRFSEEYVTRAENTLKVVRKIDKYFPEVMLIVPDEIEGKKVFLGFGGDSYRDDKKPIDKHLYIFSASHNERLYLEKVFNGQEKNYKFSYRKGNYELYFPAQFDGKPVIFYLSDYQRYGKFGS